MSKIYVSKSSLLGTFAKYAVSQSPYHRPDNLELVLDKLNELISPPFDKAPLGIGDFSDFVSLEAFLQRMCAKIPEFVEWNDRKNGNDAPMHFTSRYDKDDNPDDDFIDLDALLRNVASEVERESSDIQGVGANT
jgi:hypothetical protein